MLNDRSQQRLQGVHPKLQAVIRLAATMPIPGEVGFIVTEGLRTVKRQEQLVAAGASRTMNSLHLTGHAVDVAATVGGEVRWDWPLYTELAKVIKAAAQQLGVRVVWGGDWPYFRDGPHFQIDPKEHP